MKSKVFAFEIILKVFDILKYFLHFNAYILVFMVIEYGCNPVTTHHLHTLPPPPLR